MTRKRLTRLTLPGEHRRLARRYWFAPRGSNKGARYRELREYVRVQLEKEARQ